MSVINAWDSLGFEQHIQAIFRSNGFKVIANSRENEPGLDFITSKNGKSYAVQVKAWKKRVPANTVGRFLEFCDENDFQYGIIVSLNGFTDSSCALALKDGQKNLFLGEYNNEKNTINFINKSSAPLSESIHSVAGLNKRPIKIAIFTAKGGVGKTTISAHLAGALALSGKNVALVDIDPESNLYNLHSSNKLLVPNQKTGKKQELVVIKGQDWLAKNQAKYDAVIADCSPAFVLNPEQIIKESDIFICPVVLSPLSIGVNAEVLNRSYRQIRTTNKHAKIFILINSMQIKSSATESKLLSVIKVLVSKVVKDSNFQLISPDVLSIRESSLLRNFGHSQKLEFLNVAGRCYPRQDFLALADYLIENEYLDNYQ